MTLPWHRQGNGVKTPPKHKSAVVTEVLRFSLVLLFSRSSKQENTRPAVRAALVYTHFDDEVHSRFRGFCFRRSGCLWSYY
jgi:hypothetical protein